MMIQNMTKNKYEIITDLALNKTVEGIICNITKGNDDDTLKDLAQMIYEDLLLKDEYKIQKLYQDDQLNYFITKMVLNSINSKTSRYYYLFKKYNNLIQELEDEKERREED